MFSISLERVQPGGVFFLYILFHFIFVYLVSYSLFCSFSCLCISFYLLHLSIGSFIFLHFIFIDLFVYSCLLMSIINDALFSSIPKLLRLKVYSLKHCHFFYVRFLGKSFKYIRKSKYIISLSLFSIYLFFIASQHSSFLLYSAHNSHGLTIVIQ